MVRGSRQIMHSWRLPARGDGPHPYALGAEWVQRYFRVMQRCARAAHIRLDQRAAAGQG